MWVPIHTSIVIRSTTSMGSTLRTTGSELQSELDFDFLGLTRHVFIVCTRNE